MSDALAGLYLLKLVVGNVGTPGAPILHLSGTVYAPTGEFNGSALITQAVAPPGGRTEIPHVKGVVLHTGFGQDDILIGVSGDYVQSVPPPAIGSFLAKFAAGLVVNKEFVGRGSFIYDRHVISGVPVKPERAPAGLDAA